MLPWSTEIIHTWLIQQHLTAQYIHNVLNWSIAIIFIKFLLSSSGMFIGYVAVMCVMWVMEVMWGTVAQVEASPSEFRSPSVRCPLASLWHKTDITPVGQLNKWQCHSLNKVLKKKNNISERWRGGLSNTILRNFFRKGIVDPTWLWYSQPRKWVNRSHWDPNSMISWLRSVYKGGNTALPPS